MFSKILVANRGEIACRVMRTARRMGVATVAVYSAVDAGAPHVQMADEARAIGGAAARESYLRIEALVEAALASGSEAVHPGYGFLAENAEFAEACAAAGLVFIGPPPAAIRAMGSKSAAKARMAAAGVPLVPGYHGDDQSEGGLAAAAAAIGYPVLIKASAGGGGKGMRVVEEPGEFAPLLAAARREAQAAFGDGRVLLERFLARPRHVEIQVFADTRGACLYLGERDCSIQRRHQKVVEEAPAPGLNGALRRRMGEAAVSAARAVDYVGAGTIEFLLDREGAFHFMEMNTRLQVEHPVTELTTGLDLVEWQLRVACGEPLPLTQEQVNAHGHAIEVRLCAEDPERDYQPATGQLERLRFPIQSEHVRVDSGVREGDAITIFYDSMIAKLIVWDEDRAGALRQLRRALEATEVAGVATNAGLLAAIAEHPEFAAGAVDTGFLGRHGEALLRSADPLATVAALATLGLLEERKAATAQGGGSAGPSSPWDSTDGWRLNAEPVETFAWKDRSAEIEAVVTHRRSGDELALDGAQLPAKACLTADGSLTASIDGLRVKASFHHRGGAVTIFLHGRAYRLQRVEALPSGVEEVAAGGLAAPMPGAVIALLVEPQAHVVKGQPLLVMEAMKMEHTLKAPADGTVTAFPFAVGSVVAEGAVLVDFSPSVEA